MSFEASEAVAAELELLKNDGLLNPASVVQWASAHPESALHGQFEWDNDAAAAQWRLEQARRLIMRVKLVVSTPEGETIRVRKFVSLQQDRHSEGGYRDVSDVLRDDELRAQLLREALTELQVLRRKYGHLTELARVFAELDGLATAPAVAS